MDGLLKNLRSLFIIIHGLPSKWQLNLKKAEEHVNALANLAEQLRYVSMVSEDDPEIELMQFRNFKSLLIAKIYASAEEDLQATQKIINECGQITQELKGKLNNLEQMSDSINWSQEKQITLCGTPLRPDIIHLMGWAEDFWKYYHIQHLQMNCAIVALQLEEVGSITALQEAVRPKTDMPLSLQWALTMTRPLVADPESPASPPTADAHTPPPPPARHHQQPPSARTALYSRNV